jgi:tRNA G10  N-methylase Trm11
MGKNDFIFIKGKNPELSKFEILSYLDARNYEYKVLENAKDFLIININNADIERMINSLGGTLKIAPILASFLKSELNSALENINVKDIFKSKIKLFGVSVYAEKNSYETYKLIGGYFKKKLKQDGISTNYFGFSRKEPVMTNVEVIKKNLINESAEIVVCSKNKTYIGVTKAIHNPFEFQKRDIGRPIQRTIFSIPPRLAKILINLSGAKEGDKLLDPFCGIGTILQEAILNGINIIGLDIDENCIRGSKENLRWLSTEYNLNLNIDDKVKQGDARRLSEYFQRNSIDAIATEPYLGPPLKNKPKESEAYKIFEDIENLYEESLREMYIVLKPKKRIAIVSPCIRISKTRDVKFDFQSIVRKVGFKMVNSFIDAEERHRTFREIFVLEKP